MHHFQLYLPKSLLQHDIDVGGCLPIKQHAYHVNPTKRAEMQKEVEYLQSIALLFLVPAPGALCVSAKDNGTLHFCTDFR